jgi:Flp pilus assembly pilin Flp
MANLVKRLWQDEQGQDLAEYGIALAVIAAGVATVVITLGGTIQGLWNSAQTQVSNALAASGGN